MKTGILKFLSEGSNYLIVISNKKYSKLLAIQDYPQRKYYFKNEEVSEEKLVTQLDNIGSSERMYSEEEVFKLICDFNYDLQIDEVKDIKEWFEQFKKK
jgi:hypothetical protein